MPSSTSSSDPRVVMRAIPATALLRAALVALLLFAVLMAGWEMRWRAFGVEPSYRNSDGLWAIQRRRIDNGEGDKPVIAGSSRVLFDIQLDVWERESGVRPIQLALEGTSPVSVMEDLAEDPDFTGTLFVGVSPGLFFSGFEYRKNAFKHYREESPSQKAGQRISMVVEPYLAFYNFDYALFTVLNRQQWPAREGVEYQLEVRKLANFSEDRNTRMWSKLETDEEYRELARLIWADGFVPFEERDEEWRQGFIERRQLQIDRAVAATQKLEARGVEVIFLRMPAEGHYTISESTYNPRAQAWDVLIEETGALGIHWQDHEELQGYWLPEWSHLSASEADRFTAALYHVIQRERQNGTTLE